MELKILHLSSERSWRGGEQQIAYLIGELIKQNIEVVVAVKAGSEFEKYCRQNNIDHHSMAFSNSLDFSTAVEINKLCKKLRPTLIHLHSSKSHGIAILSSMLGNKTPLILSRRVDFVPKDNFLTKFKYNHSSIHRIICVSHKIDEIMRSYVNRPEISMTIHSGIDIEKFNRPVNENVLRKEFSMSEDTFLIGNTSALEHHKDYFTFLNTLKILIERGLNVKAFIIGTGSLQDELNQYAISLELTDYVHFTGFRKDIINVLPSLNLFLITSNEEGLGTSVLDAFAAGVPVIGTIAGGIPEMIEHNKTGMLAEIGDASTLADNIQTLIEDPNLREVLIQNAKAKLKHFSKEETARKTIKVYQEILNSPSQN